MNENNSSQICRACLASSEKMYALHGRIVNVDMDIASMISFCTSEELPLDQGLPDYVCVPCFRIIRKSYNFFRQFRETQKRLLQLKQGDNSNSIELEFVNGDEPDTSSAVQYSVLPPTRTKSTEINFEFITVFGENESSEESEENPEDATESILLEISDDQSISNSNGDVEIPESNKMCSEVIKSGSAAAKIYSCPICNREFDHLHKFTCHVLLHKTSKVVCDKCPTPVTFSMSDYINHFKVNHRYQCRECGKSLTSSYGYKYHMKLHENIRKFKCPVKNCKRTYFLDHLLKRHMLSHSKMTNYKCDLCGAGFRTYDTLKYHLKTHDGKRNHHCTVCGKDFFQAVHLRDHMFSHMNLRQFTCVECGRSFNTSSQLNTHTKRHKQSTDTPER